MVRLNYIPRLATATETWFMDANLIAIWSAVEPGLGIIASSLATLRPLFRGLFRTGNTQISSSDITNLRFTSFKNAIPVEELPRKSSDERQGTIYDSFEFIQGGLPSIKTLPAGPHQHIPKAAWKPGAPKEHRVLGRMGKAEELLGEDLSAFSRTSESIMRTTVVRTRPQLGNVVRCEGPPSPDLEKRRVSISKQPSRGSLQEQRKFGSARPSFER
jgi:hypothetical protein